MATRITESAAAENAAGPTRREASDEEVAIRAHEIFVNRGGEHGRDRDDWMQARRELSPEQDAGDDQSER
jgi:Protein of unknown function (DUF2934)